MAEPTFAKAFAAARKAKGPGKTFTWGGKSYSTNTAEDAKGKSSATPKPKARPADKAPKPAAGGARPAPGGAGKLPAAKPKAAPARAAQFEPTTKPTQGPKPKAAETNASRMDKAKAEAAAARAKTRAAAGVGGSKPASKPTPSRAGAVGGKLQAVKDFFNGGGLAGMRARQRAAKPKA